MIEHIKTKYGQISVRTTSLAQINIRVSAEGSPNNLVVLNLDGEEAEALQNALARARGDFPRLGVQSC
jgi:hypothetical protein